jgi:hypothetical protein
MLLRQISTGHYVEVLDLHDLTNPFSTTLTGRLHWGEEPSDPELFAKDSLSFVSGEPLPECWLNEHYRDDELARRIMQPDQLRAH